MDVKPERYNEYQKDTMTGMKDSKQKSMDRNHKSHEKKEHLARKMKGGKAHDTTKRSMSHDVRHGVSSSNGKDQKGYFENRDSNGKLVSYGIKH